MHPQNYFYDDAIASSVFEWLDAFKPLDAGTLSAVRAFPLYIGDIPPKLAVASATLTAWTSFIFAQSCFAAEIIDDLNYTYGE